MDPWTAVGRIEAFIARRQLVAPTSTVVWSDPHAHAQALRLDDLRYVIEELKKPVQ